MEADFPSLTVTEWDERRDTINYENPELDEPVDKLPKSNRIRSFYFVKYRKYQNVELETKIDQAEEQIKNLDKACELIRGIILEQKKLNDDGNRGWLRSQLFDLVREDDRYKDVINEKKTKIDYIRQAGVGRLRAILIRENGDDKCLSERELNNRVCSMHFRTRCAKNTFIGEKQLLKKIKQLEETRQEIIVDDALKQKRYNDLMKWVDRPTDSCNSSRNQKNLKDMDLGKLKREKQVFSARVKNAEEKWKSLNNEISSLELKLARAVKKRTVEEKLLVKLKEQRSKENFNYNHQYYNKYKSLLENARKLAANKNIATLEELSHKEVEYFTGLWTSKKPFRDDYLKRTTSYIPEHASNELHGPFRNHRDKQPISSQPVNTNFGMTERKCSTQTKSLFIHNTKLRVQNGWSLRFWEDSWIFSEPMSLIYPALYSSARSKLKLVSEILEDNFDSLLPKLLLPRRIFPAARGELNLMEDALQKFKYAYVEDMFRWRSPSAKGLFLVRSCYEKLVHSDNNTVILDFDQKNSIVDDKFSFICQLKIPPNIIFFLWQSFHNKLSTRDNMISRRLDIPSTCLFCTKDETSAHLLLHCSTARNVWAYFTKELNWFFTTPSSVESALISWQLLTGGTRDRKIWNTIPPAILWCLWNARNDKAYNNKLQSLTQIINIVKYTIYFWNLVVK